MLTWSSKTKSHNAKDLTQSSALPLSQWRHSRRAKALGILMTAAALVVAAVVARQAHRSEYAYQGRPVSAWVREALDDENWESTTNARHVVTTRLKSQAVPYLVQELRAWCYPRPYYWLHHWQYRMPAMFRVLPEPKEPRGAISAAAWIVSEMEEEGAPVYGDLARCLRGANIHLWEFVEVMNVLIQAGPVAKGALPTLRQMAADKRSGWRVAAALAIYNTDGSTNALAEALRAELAKPDRYSHFDREIWWFRGDETVQEILLPLVCPVALDPSRSVSERSSVVWQLGELLTTNTLPRRTLETLRGSDCDPELAEEVRTALEKISQRDKEETIE